MIQILHMNTVRTTIVLDTTLHRQLSIQAAMLGVGLSDLINNKLANKNVGSPSERTANIILKNLSLFRILGKKTAKTDWATLVREERERDRD